MRGGQVKVTAAERRNIFKFFNVAEAARQLGVDYQWLYREIRSGRTQPPTVNIGKRFYFNHEDLNRLAKQYKKGIKR